MDLGCLDMGCIEKQSNETVLDSENNANESLMTTTKIGKNKALKEASQSNASALNKFTSQIKRPLHRKGSPLNWFPRKKVDSYLKRKIKLLQEVSGMNSTLDETLGDSNPHYSRVLREKIAVREAAQKAMEARKAAMVEASWCRILQAARIQRKDAEALLLEAENRADEAFEAATAVGVIMHDIPDCSRKHYEIETLSANGGGSTTTTTHTVTASFETAFEVDKQVAAAVKAAFNRLANCPYINKEEFEELLRKISQNPDTGENNQELSEVSSECESDTGSELESGSHKEDGLSYQDLNCETAVAEARERKYKMRQLSEKFNMTKLVDMMLERLERLHEDELASLATIVATCGLNAALAEAENWKQHDLTSAPAHNVSRRMSSLGAGMVRNSNMDGQMRKKQVEAEVPSLDKFLVKHLTKLEREVQEAKSTRRKEASEENRENLNNSDNGKVNLVNNTSSAKTILDLGSILVKHSSKFEKEIEEAKKKNSGYIYEKEHKNCNSNMNSSEVVPDLGSVLTKHTSKLEKEIEETKRKYGKSFEMNGKNFDRLQNEKVNHAKQDVTEVPSLDKFLVKHVSKLEREVQEAKNRRKFEKNEGNKVTELKKSTLNTPLTQPEGSAASSCSDGGGVGKENINLTLLPQNATDCSGDSLIQIEREICEAAKTLPLDKPQDESKETEDSLENILVKPVHRLEREKMQALSLQRGDNRIQRYQKKHGGHNVTDCESLDKVLVKHVSGLEKEKMSLGMKEEAVKIKRRETNTHLENSESSLDQILVKRRPRLEREKMAAAQQPHDQVNHSAARREARERELQEAWGGLSLGNSIRPHLSRLQRDKADWVKAEEEERERAI